MDTVVPARYLNGHGRSREVFQETVRMSTRVFGTYTLDGDIVGFARAISGGHAFAYLTNVYVLPIQQGNGFGANLFSTMINGSPLPNAHWMLGARDAHGLHE